MMRSSHFRPFGARYRIQKVRSHAGHAVEVVPHPHVQGDCALGIVWPRRASSQTIGILPNSSRAGVIDSAAHSARSAPQDSTAFLRLAPQTGSGVMQTANVIAYSGPV